MNIVSLINEPNLEDPLNEEIGEKYQNDRKKFNEKAREWTSKFAM